MNNILSQDQIKLMRKSGQILASVMKEVSALVKPGISTDKLDDVAKKLILNAGATPSFLNYEVAGVGKYPASLCVSINSEIVHGLPRKSKVLTEGDIVSLDLGVSYKGICTDMAVTLPVGKITKDAQRLIDVTKECLGLAISKAKAGNHIGAIGEVVEGCAYKNSFGVVRDLVGHGIGAQPHMDPQIPNFGKNSDGPVIKEGMALAIEPMITFGDYHIKSGNDGWTISTKDGSLAAHFEHTVVIINNRAEIVTK